jgi:hypothetical protein
MKADYRRPAWWQLYLLGFVMVGLLVLGAWAPLSELGHQLAAIGALLLIYGLLELWLRANRRALLRVNELVLSQTPRPKAVRETPDEECVPVYVFWRPPLGTEMVEGGDGNHGTDQSIEEVLMEPRSGAQPAIDIPLARRQ